jgi:hypothetical protein
MKRYEETTWDVTSKVFGWPLFAVVSLVSGAVLAVGWTIVGTFERLTHS